MTTSTWHTPRRLSALALSGFFAACAHGGGPDRTASDEDVRGAPENPEVTSDDLERAPDQPIEQVLATRFPGVTITRTADGGIAIRIRGRTSIEGGDEPLYVIDGMPTRPGPAGGLHGINPYDIESIRVLRDPAETAMYGVRGANGVILIRTKRPPAH